MWTKSIDSCGEKGNFYKFFPHTLRSTKSIDSFGGNGDFFFKLQNMDFSWLDFGLKIGLFAEIFEPEGVVFHKYYD